MIKLGSNSIGKIYLGNNSIGKAYLGNNLVFQSGGTPPTPPTGVVFYDRLVFDGTAYIDTNIIPDANASYRVGLGDETIKSAQRLFFIPASNGAHIGVMFNSHTTSTSRQFSFYYGNVSEVVTGKNLRFDAGGFSLFLTPKRCGWPDNIFSFTKGPNTPSGGLVIGTIPSHTGQPYSGKIRSYFRIYGSDAQDATSPSDLLNYTPEYTLRPCTYNGEAGLWCVETSTFYGNTAGAGALTVENNS